MVYNGAMLHHIELYVGDLERSIAFWTPFCEQLGYTPDRWSGGINYRRGNDDAYLSLLAAEEEHLAAGFHRKRIGLNHLAFCAASREAVDALAAWAEREGHPRLYHDRYPFATAPGYYALFLEDPDRMKVEVVAPDED